ncbi:MAG: RNA polymerase sigma factor [Phycisphaerae bacterium]|nr:RNA polymerase sigma factor [Phycisphaerae bacterium]
MAIPLQLGLPIFGRGPVGPDAADTDASSRIIDRVSPRAPSRGRSRGGSLMQDWTDEALLEAYVGGNRGALAEIIHRYRDELLHFLIRFLSSRAAAEDVFQETFLQVHLSAESFDTSRRLKPWLFTIAANKARDHHRKHGRRAAVSLSASIGDDGDGQRFVDLMEADLPTPDLPVVDAERSRLVRGVVDALPAHLREILLLSYFQRLSYNQIADALEIPLGTVKSRLHTAVAAFARAWTAARATEQGEQT